MAFLVDVCTAFSAARSRSATDADEQCAPAVRIMPCQYAILPCKCSTMPFHTPGYPFEFDFCQQPEQGWTRHAWARAPWLYADINAPHYCSAVLLYCIPTQASASHSLAPGCLNRTPTPRRLYTPYAYRAFSFSTWLQQRFCTRLWRRLHNISPHRAHIARRSTSTSSHAR